MATDRLRIVVDEILVTIKQTFDDKEVSRAQAAYWTIVVANQLLGKHIANRDSGAFLTVYIVPVLESTVTQSRDIIKGRKYIELPGGIFDYDKDGGVEYVAYYNTDEECDPEFAKKTILRTSPGELQWLRMEEKTAPSAKNPYWYRVGNYIPLVGLEKVPVKEIEIGIYQTIDPLETIDIDQPFHFPQELLHVLKRQVVDLARFSFLFDPQQDRANDGSDNSGNTGNVPKILSVNEQQQEE